MRDGWLTFERGRITAVDSRPWGRSLAGAGDIAILPALINAHTHLEFSERTTPIGTPRLPFPDWIRQVVAWRRARESASPLPRGTAPSHAEPAGPGQGGATAGGWRRQAVLRGAAESRQAGTGALGEIATESATLAVLSGEGWTGVVFRELLGLPAERIPQQVQAAEEFLAAAAPAQPLVRGLSPHAPYSVHPDLLRAIVHLADRRDVPLAMHLAESEQEMELLACGTGAFVDLLTEFQAWEPSAIPIPSRPLDYLQLLSRAPRTLVIHGNYLSGEEIEFLGQRRERMSLVYCPRTHAYFGHRPYPLDQIRRSGVRLVLGTDSRASNPDLSLWEELRYAVGRHPGPDPLEWLRSATADAAAALGLPTGTGTLRRGAPASFLVVSLPDGGGDDPRACLLDPRCRLAEVYLGGERVAGTGRETGQDPLGGG